MIVTQTNNAAHAIRRVYLNGKAQEFVIAADDEKGEVTCHVMDKAGNPKLVGKEFATITETGNVEFELNYGWRYDTVAKKFVLLPKHLLH